MWNGGIPSKKVIDNIEKNVKMELSCKSALLWVCTSQMKAHVWNRGSRVVRNRTRKWILSKIHLWISHCMKLQQVDLWGIVQETQYHQKSMVISHIINKIILRENKNQNKKYTFKLNLKQKFKCKNRYLNPYIVNKWKLPRIWIDKMIMRWISYDVNLKSNNTQCQIKNVLIAKNSFLFIYILWPLPSTRADHQFVWFSENPTV